MKGITLGDLEQNGLILINNDQICVEKYRNGDTGISIRKNGQNLAARFRYKSTKEIRLRTRFYGIFSHVMVSWFANSDFMDYSYFLGFSR